MGKIEAVLDKILQDAFSVAVATLKEEAAGIVANALKGALEARLKALLEEDNPTSEVIAPARAKAKATTTEEVKEGEAKPRRRKTEARQDALEEDLSAILEGVRMALEKYRGITTPKGKELPDVLFRRVRKLLEHAQALGRRDPATLARSALAYIHADPRGVAMGSWKALAEKVGLPVPIGE